MVEKNEIKDFEIQDDKEEKIVEEEVEVELETVKEKVDKHVETWKPKVSRADKVREAYYTVKLMHLRAQLGTSAGRIGFKGRMDEYQKLKDICDEAIDTEWHTKHEKRITELTDLLNAEKGKVGQLKKQIEKFEQAYNIVTDDEKEALREQLAESKRPKTDPLNLMSKSPIKPSRY